MPHDFIVAIPARHAATRLPGKPLRLLAGEPLVLHVARRALAAGAREAWVATDDTRVADALQGSGVQVAMTAATHASGSSARTGTLQASSPAKAAHLTASFSVISTGNSLPNARSPAW